VPHAWWVSFAAALLFFSQPAEAAAQAKRQARAGTSEQGKEPAGYREAIDRALEEAELGNFAEAREQFARAHTLFPNARTLRGLGISEFELRHYLVSVDYLDQALASGVKPLEGNLRKETESLLTRASSYLGALRIALTPSSATLVIDGARTVASLSEPVRLEVGDHLLEFRASGYVSERRQVTVRGGQSEPLEVQLTAATASAAAREPAPAVGSADQTATRSEHVPVYKRWWLWTAIGVVVVGATVGTVIALKADKTDTKYRAIDSKNTPPGAGLQPLWKY
jgi:tetratricopeptide (TPR) repeat protein